MYNGLRDLIKKLSKTPMKVLIHPVILSLLTLNCPKTKMHWMFRLK